MVNLINRDDAIAVAMHSKDPVEGIKNLPAVDAVPVRYGKWIVKRYAPGGRGRTVRFCSECGANNWNRKSNYCPNCGIRMRGEEYAVD